MSINASTCNRVFSGVPFDVWDIGLDYGIQAVISTEIADIFTNNALKNGLIPVIVDTDTHRWLLEHPGVELTVDLESTTLQLPDNRRISFPIDAFSRFCLMNGTDQLGFLIEQQDAIQNYEQTHR